MPDQTQQKAFVEEVSRFILGLVLTAALTGLALGLMFCWLLHSLPIVL